MKKILTIVVPTYNVEKYLDRCIQTLVYDENALKDCEILVVNDGSKDNSLQIAKTYEKKYPDSIKVIDKENGGHGSTINAGLKVATGKYFRVIDSDDWVNIDDFGKYVQDLKNIDADIVLTDYTRELLYSGEIVEFNYSGLEYNRKYDLDKFDFSKLKDDYFFMATTTFKTEKLKKANVVLDEKTFYVDMEFILFPILEIKTMTYLDYNIYRYFIGRPEQSISINSYVRNRKDHEKVLKKILKFYSEIKENDNRKKYVHKIILQLLNSHYIIYCKAQLNNKKDIREIREFTKFLKMNYNSLYNELRNEHEYIKWNQNTNFKLSQINNNIFSRLADRREFRKISRRGSNEA